MLLLVRLLGFGAETTSSDPPFHEPSSAEWVADYLPIEWSVKRQQDNTGSWSFSVPYTERFADELKQYSEAYFYLDGEELIRGYVDDLQIDLSGDKIVYRVTGLGEAVELDKMLSQNFSHYDNVEVIVIIQELLMWAGWALGDFSTMQDATIKTTIDLRDQETVLQQIRRVCEAVPGVHWRWGGYDCLGRPTLDIGFFDEVSDIRLEQGSESIILPSNDHKVGQIKSAQIRKVLSNLISEVHGNGGTYNLSGDPDKQRVMTLWHVNELFTVSPGLENPDYPLITDGHGFFRIRNNAIYPQGSSIRKTWDFMVTENEEPPTVTELGTAAYGLYLKCIRFLQEHADTSDTYDLTIAGLQTFPLPGDRIRADANYLVMAIPGYGAIPVEGEQIHDDYRIISWDMKGSGDNIEISTNLTENEFINAYEEEEDIIEIDRGYENASIKDRASGIICGDYAITVIQDDETDVAGPGASPDCTLCDGTDGILITIAFTPGPGTSHVKFIGIFPTATEDFIYEIVQQPTVIGELMDDPAIICFRYTDHPWDTTDSVSIKTYIRTWG